jgi:glutathione S-transferase
MKLLWSSRSPFARKVTIAAHELGIADRIAMERVVVSMADPSRDVMRFNPLGRIPALILDDGAVLHDSRVIIEYLDVTFGGGLLPPAGEARWRALTLQALADGLMESDLRWLEESRFDLAQRREPYVASMKAKIAAGLDSIEAAPPSTVTVGEIALGSMLAHLDFRFPGDPWRPSRPTLSAWFETFAARPSMVATKFVDQY